MYKYLGIYFTTNGHFNRAILKLKDQASRAMYALVRRGRQLKLPPDIMLDLFEKMIIPILLYGSEVWGCYNTAPLEIVQNRFCKLIMKWHWRTPTTYIHHDLRVLPIETRVKIRILSYWIKTINSPNQRKWNVILMNTLFEHVRNQYSGSSWVSFVQTTLLENGLGHVLTNPFAQTTNASIYLIKQRFHDQFDQFCNGELEVPQNEE